MGLGLRNVRFHNGFEQFNADDDQHEKAEYFKQLFYAEEKIRRLQNVLNDELAQIKGGQPQSDGHHHHQDLDGQLFILLQYIEQHRFALSSNRNITHISSIVTI